MTRTQQILRFIGFTLTLVALALILLFVLALFGTVSFELIAHLAAGFVFFLMDRLPRTSTDHATWLPGIAAFLLATGLAHLLLNRFVRNRGGVWRLKTTACLTFFIPVLFVISFIIPGALLQIDSLLQDRWFEHYRSATKATVVMEIRNLGMACQAHVSEKAMSTYPDSLDEIYLNYFSAGKGWIRSSDNPHTPAERPIYLGAGMPIDTESADALLVSPAFDFRGSLLRVVYKFNGSIETIPAREAEQWIDRALENRR